MKAFVINGRTDASVQDVPTPQPAPGQALVRMAYGGICGSDLHYYYDGAVGAFTVRQPLIPGHEMSGIVEVDTTGRLAPGTRVTVHPATFGQCRPGLEAHPHLWPQGAYLGSASTWPHTQGGMSEYLLVEASMLRPLPDSLPLDRAALAEPLSVGLHGINLAGGVRDARVLVSGAGPIGLLLAAAAVAQGAAEVHCTDVLAGPLQRARHLGVTETFRIGTDEVPTESYDIAFECAGVAAATNTCIQAVRRAGTLVQIGMLAAGPQGIEMAGVVAKELTLRGSFRFKDEIDAAIEMLDRHPEIGDVVTHTVAANNAEQAFATARDAEQSGKVLLDLWHDGQLR